MSYREVLVRIPAADRERYLDAVGALCGSGIYVEDYTDMAETLRSVRYDYIDETLLKKDAGSVTVHFYPEEGEADEILRRAAETAAALGIPAETEQAELQDADWAESWKAQFPAVKSGRFLVLPPWESPGETELIPLVIGSASAYGTGQSPNTQLCLEALSALDVRGKVLDVGAGTGILGIGALLLGADSATGLDIEAESVENASENARNNGVGDRFVSLLRTRETEGRLPDGGFRLVICHITADVILRDLPFLIGKTAPDGALLLGGIRADREAEMTQVLERYGMAVRSSYRKEEWVTLICERRKN